jgi:signal transduction histidine kinase
VFALFADVPWVVRDCRRALAGEEPRGSGEIAGAWIDIHYTPVREEGGRVESVIGVASEVTDRQQLLMTGHLDSVGTLAAGIAHEVNNPLAYVMGNMTFVTEEIARCLARIGSLSPGAERLCLDAQLDDLRESLSEMDRAIEDAQGGAERIRRIVKNLAIIAESDEGRRGPVQIERVVELAIAMTEHEIKRRARLVREYEAVPPAEANEARLGQVVLHLLFNATQAIAADKPHENEIRVGIHWHASGRIAVEVADSGSGIAPEHLRRIFDPYFTTKPMGAGAGLGLSICHGIVKALGGEIEAESALGRGSTFRVLLPPSSP